MAWYDEAVFYHIYPLGLTGAPKQNSYGAPEHRLNTLLPWISHIKSIGCNALYIGPLFESVGHGYETTDYKKLDSRLGTNEDLTAFVAECHKQGIRVIFDGVFNHTGRDFFAFRDILQNRENSPYKDWYCNVNFYGNNSYNDGFSYENWGGYDLLAKLNQHNPAVRDYICDVIRFWVKEFDIDGIRLDAADVMDFNYMKISNRLIFIGCGIAFLRGILLNGTIGAIKVLFLIFFPIVILYLLFLTGILGAGDIKLFSLIGGFVELKELIICMLYTFLIAGVFSFGKMLYYHTFKSGITRGMSYIAEFLAGNRKAYTPIAGNEQYIHFSVAVFLGFLWSQI